MENWVRNAIADDQERVLRDDADDRRDRKPDDSLIGLAIVALVLLWGHHGPVLGDALYGVGG